MLTFPTARIIVVSSINPFITLNILNLFFHKIMCYYSSPHILCDIPTYIIAGGGVRLSHIPVE
jgi:hypothetical protein